MVPNLRGLSKIYSFSQCALFSYLRNCFGFFGRENLKNGCFFLKQNKTKKKRDPVLFTYIFHGVNFETQQSTMYLGITLETKPSWNEDCDAVYRKTCFMLSFLGRNVKKFDKKLKNATIWSLQATHSPTVCDSSQFHFAIVLMVMFIQFT